MRKINPLDFEVAKRTTSREINRRIALNLIRAHQPISRADVARKMNVGRGVITLLINELIAARLVYEGEGESTLRGRRPTNLFIRTEGRFVVAVDIRVSRTYLMLTDFGGQQIALETFNTILDPKAMIADLAERVQRLLKTHQAVGICHGVGVAVPGIVKPGTGIIRRAPTLGWEDVNFGDELAGILDIPVHIENASNASALGQMWINREDIAAAHNFAFVSVSDGVGVGLVANGELMRGQSGVAGEFGHVPLSLGGPLCLCGKRGCWEAYASNLATISRYLGKKLEELRSGGVPVAGNRQFSIHDVIDAARSGEKKAKRALTETGFYLGIGLAIVVNAFNPERIYVGGEITLAWDLIGESIVATLQERAITVEAGNTPISVATATEFPRLMGAAALIIAPTFAALKVA